KIVNFKNAVIILTSNVGSTYFREISSLGFGAAGGGEREAQEQKFREQVMTELRQTFKPEFLNRLDDITIFNSLSPSEIGKIVDIQLEKLMERLREREITLVVKPEVRRYLVEHGFDPDFGARPIKRLIQKIIVDALADKMVRGEVKNGQKVNAILTKSQRVELTR
ncbi:MAG: AAA family ATPase, partial [Patescibacteria group bacterium]